MTDERPVRLCDACGGVDNHPRHVFAYAGVGENAVETSDDIAFKALSNAGEEYGAQILAQIRDTSTVMRHMDCCREAGCPDGTCNQVTAGAENLRGDDLVKHLTREN